MVHTDAGASQCVVVSGPAGSGKTALLRAAAVAAGTRGHRTVTISGHETDRELAYTALGELIGPFLDQLPDMQPLRAAALRAALGVSGEALGDRFTTGAAALDLLAAASAAQSLTIVVDDLQWVDDASLDVIAFVARRLTGERLLLLLGLRTPGPSPVVAVLEGLDQIGLGPLADADAEALLAREAPGASPGHVARLIALSGGNPLALVELAKDTEAGPEDDPPSLPGEHPAERAFRHRVEQLPETTRRALLAVVVAGTGQLDTTALLDRFGLASDALDPAESSGLGAWESSRFVMRHPLVNSAVLGTASAAAVRDAHDRLGSQEAAALDDRAVLHRSAASVGPDAQTADALDRLGRANLARGALVPAADAFEQAARLSPDDDLAAQRLVEAAEAWARVGHYEHAEAHAEAAIARSSAAVVQVAAQRTRTRARRALGHSPSGQRELLAALDGLGPEHHRLAGLVWIEAAVESISGLDATRAVDNARRSLALVGTTSGTGADLAHAVLGAALILAGAPGEAGPHLDRWRPLLAHPEVTAHELRSLAAVGLALVWAERFEASHELFDGVIAAGRRLAMPTVLPVALLFQSILDFALGNWSAAVASAGESAELAEQTNDRALLAGAYTQRALLAALQGRAEEAETLVGQVLAGQTGPVGRLSQEAGLSALADQALGRSQFELAVELLEPLLEGQQERNPAPTLWEGPLIEGYVGCGRQAEAEALLDSFGDRVDEAGHVRGQAMAARCRGLLPQADFDRWFARSVDLLDVPRVPFARARTELYWGEHLVVAGRFAEAHHRLLRAVREFDRLEAAPWADRAVDALRRLGERPSASAEAPGLSERERLVLRTVAIGTSIEDAATTLFLSPQTITQHLAAALAKLGIDDPAESPDRVTARREDVVTTTISLLGTFRVTRDDEDLTPTQPQPARLLQILAVHNGRAHADELIEALWPDVDPVVGRTRLRNVMARVRRQVGGELLARAGDLVQFGDDVEVDATLFEDEAARALAVARAEPDEAATLARRALGRYRGEILSDARYEPWAASLRDRCRQRLLALLDLLAQHAAAEGDLDGALGFTEQAIQLEPLDEHRYLAAVPWLIASGRRGTARTLLAQGRAAWLELDLEPSDDFQEVERTL